MADSVLDMLRQKQNDSVLEYLEQSRRPVEATPSGSEFGKGLASASAATAAGLRAFAANLAENFAPEWSKSQLKEINRLTASAQANAPRVTDLRQIGDASDLGDYIMGGLGQAVPSITTALVGSRLGIRGLNAAGFKLNPLAAGMVGGTVGMLPQEAGEAAVTMYNDPVAMANTTAAERTALMLGKGGINAALESIVPTMMGQKVLGGAAKLIRPGFKPAMGHAAKEMGKAGMYEAGTEAAQQVTGQAFHHLANPNEDLLAGGWDIANAAAQGFFPGAVMGGAGAGADILKSNLTQTVDKDGSVIPGGLASTLRGAKDDAHQAGVAGGERSGSAVKSLYERVSGWADRLAGSNKDVETRRSAVLDSLHPEQQRIRDLIAPYFMNEDDSGTAYASARDLILASRHSLESKDFVPLDALSMFKPGKEGEGLSTLARYMKHVGMIDNDETLGITKALKRRDIWRELLALNIDPKYGELTTAQLDDIAGNIELALMSSSGQLGFSSEYGFSGDYSEPDQVFQQGMLDLFGSKARHVREMIDKYDLHPRTGVKSQLGGLGSVGEQQDAAGVTPNDGAGTNAYGDAVGEAEDFGSDAVLDDGDTAPEFSDRLREFDSEDSDKESIKFDDLDKWFTKKEMPWSDEQLPATDTPNGQKLRAARISQNANMMRVINKQGESTLVPDDGIYLKRGNKLIDKETGAYRGPEIQRVTARTLIEKAREAAQHSDWTHDALTNPESLLSDFLRGLSMIIDAGQFTSLGTVKQGKVSGVGKEMKFEELYRINLDDKLYDTRAAALEAAKKLDKPAQTAQKGDKWVVQLTNSQEVLNKKTGTFDSIVSALKHIPDTLELMPGITVGDAKKALTAKMRKEGYTGPVSEKDLIAEGMKPRKAFKQAQFLNHPKTFTYTSRKQQPVAELAHEYSVIDQQIKALGDDASPSADFQIKGLSALQSKLYDEIVRRLREAGEVDRGTSFVEMQDLVNDVVSHPEGWTSLDPELDFEDPKRKNYSLAQVEHKPDFSPPRNSPIIAAQVAPTESAARAYAETTGGRAVHNPETGEWMVVAGLSEKKYTEAELDSIKRVKTTKAGGYSPQSQTKTKDLRDSSKDGKDITRNKWVPEGLPQELDTFRKPKKTEANAIPEDHRTPGDIESDMLDIRKFDEETDEPLHEDRGAIRKHAQTIGEQLDALEDNLKKLRAEGAHKKHIENAERQLAALQATADEAAKAVDVFKDLRSSLRFGESTEPGASERALKEAGAPRHIIEEARKNQTDRAALIDQAEELVLRLLSASSLLGPKDSPVATGKLTKEIYDAIRLNKPLDRFQVRVQRHLRRAINEARKSRRAVGEQKTSIADTINMVADETNLTLYKVPPPEQLAAIMEFIQQVTNGAMTLTSEKVIGALKRAAGFDATYLGFGLEDTLRQVMTKAGITVPPKFGKQPRKLVLAPSKKEAPVKEAPKQAPKQAPAEKAGTYDNPIIGDIWAQDGFKVVSTNLGGVHGRGLAKQAKDKGLINNLNKNFESSPLKNKVITLAVKGNAPETAKVPGRAFSEQVVGGNLELLKSEVRKLIKYARANPGEKFFLPYIGLGFGEGNAADIKPVLEFAAKEPNIFMVAKDQATVATYADSFKPGVRRDATTRGERGADAASAISAKPDANDYGMSPDADAASDDLTDEVEAIRQQNRKDAIKLLKSLGGIGTKELSDITGEAKRRNDVPVGLLIKNPKWGLDELGRILASHGFLTEDQGEDVESVRDFLRDVLTGQGVTRLGTEDQLYLNFDVKHNKQSAKQRDIRTAFGAIDEASKTDDVRRGRDLISMALHHIERSDAPDAQKWSARQKVLRAESELRRKAMMQDAAQHEVDIRYNKQGVGKRSVQDVNKSIASFFEQNGVEINISTNGRNAVKAISKILDLDVHKPMPYEAAEMLSYMVIGSEFSLEVEKTIKNTAYLKYLIDQVDSSYGNYGARKREAIRRATQKLLENGFNKEYLRTNNIPESFVKKVLDVVKRLLVRLQGIDMGAAIRLADGLVKDVLAGNMSVLITQSGEKVDFQSALDATPAAKAIVEKLSDTNAMLTGSIALARQVSIYRPGEMAIHDLDFVTTDSEAATQKMVAAKFPGSVEIRNFGTSSHHTVSFIIPPAGLKLRNIDTHAATADVVDSDGVVVGTTSSGQRAMVVDFFVDTSQKELNDAITADFVTSSGKKSRIKLASMEHIFSKKIMFGREKDVRDFNSMRRNNSQNPNAETPDGPDYAPMSDEQKKDIEELLKILAPQAAVEFANALDGNTSGAWMRNKKTGARLIRLSVYAKHPHSVAYHEALHDLFQTLREAGHEATIRVLERVATQANVKRRLAQLLDGEDAAIAQLEDPEEAAAYLFQFWALGYQGPNKPNTMIKGLGPQTESFFQRLWYAIKDVLGWLTEQDKAELIMRSFFHGKLNDPVATKAILDKVEHDAGRYDAAMRPLTKHLNKVFSTADERLRATLDKDMIEIADLFYPSLKGDSRARFFNDRDTEDNLGLFDSVFQMSNKGLAQLHDMVSEMTADDLRSAIDHLQMATKYEDIEAGHVRALVRETHKVLRKYHEYLREAGVLNYDGRPLGDLGASYFPRNWNFDMLVENGSELVADLLKHHMPDLTAIAEKAKENARAKDKDADVSGHEYTPEGVAEYILRKLTDSQGVETLTQDADGKPVGALHESGIDLGFTPLMMAVNSRTLTFLDMKHFHKYLEKDYIKTMSTYATQAVKRAEYTRRFGPSGERIRDALKNAAHSKYLEKARAQWGSDFEKKLSDIKKEAAKAGSEEAEQIAYDKLTRAAFDDFANLDKKFSAESRAYADELAPVIQALEGTLGRDISDTLRAVNSWMMTYQNWRTLPLSLFASFTDPLGIVMKGGSAKQAYKAFVRGVKEVWRTWRGSPTTGADDIEAEMAKMVGALEASALMDALGQTYSSVYMTGKAKKLNDLLFKLNGMEAWNRAMRTQAAVAGIDWLKSAIGTTDTTVLRQIEELGLKPSDLKLSLKNPGMLDMSDKKIQRALMRWINQAILRPNAAQRPVFASNPKTAIFFHLMQYTYSMQKVILGNAFHEARHGNYQPIVTLGVAYTPIAIAAMALRGLIQGGGDEPEWMKGMGPADWLVLGINRAGITGIPGSILENNLNTDIAPIEGENFVTKGIIGAADAAMGTMFPMPAVDQLLDIISPASEKTWDENAVRALPLNAMYRGWFGY